MTDLPSQMKESDIARIHLCLFEVWRLTDSLHRHMRPILSDSQELDRLICRTFDLHLEALLAPFLTRESPRRTSDSGEN